jgi:hypothetical protein
MSRIDPIKEAKAAASLRASIAAVDSEDEALLLDTIEGETGLFEAIDYLLSRMAVARAGLVGIEAVKGELDARKERYAKRIDTDRALIEQAMSVAEITSIERPAATLTLSARAPSLRIETESDIPAKYWKDGAPTLDKKALLADLKARAKALDTLPSDPAERALALAAVPEIPGAALSNGAPSITIRTA